MGFAALSPTYDAFGLRPRSDDKNDPRASAIVAKRHTAYDPAVKAMNWSAAKNTRLIAERGVSFEEVLSAIAHGGLLDVLEHPNKASYPGQRMFVVRIRGYAYLVPFVETDTELFMKTIIPSRKATRAYLGAES